MGHSGIQCDESSTTIDKLMLWVELCPQNSSTEVLTHSTHDCDLA